MNELPTIEDKINALADAIEAIATGGIEQFSIVVSEMRRVIDQETQS